VSDDAAALRRVWRAEERHAFSGWDFSHLDGRWQTDPLPWDYGAIVAARLRPDDDLLDLGTGGGEFLLSLRHPPARTCVTEAWPPNVALVRQRLVPLGITLGVTGDDDRLPFPDARFDVVLNRHESYDPAEVARVLRPGGTFVTQQVGGDNGHDLALVLLPGLPDPPAGGDLATHRAAVERAGLSVVRAEESYPVTRFFDVGAVVFYARVIEWEYPGFSVERCYEALLGLNDRLRRGEAVTCQEHRFLVVATKP